MITSIQKWGNSQGIRIPKSVLDLAGIPATGPVELTIEPDAIVIKKIAQQRPKSLRELFNGYDGTYTCSEWDTGADVGKEIL